MRFSLTFPSANRKTGPIPVASSSRDTCPTSCSFLKICYGEVFPISLHWDRLSEGERGMTFEEVLMQIRALPFGIPWRWGDVGDLPGQGDQIDPEKLAALTDANAGKRGFAYTHKPPTQENIEAVALANAAGFTVNFSAEGTWKPDLLADLLVAPVVTVLPSSMDPKWRISQTQQGRRIVRCPAEYQGEGPRRIQCSNCGGRKGPLCSMPDRDYIVGFTSHGTAGIRQKVDAKIAEVEGI